MKIEYKIALFVTLLLTLVVGSVGFLTSEQIGKTVETQMGNNAMDMARTVASLDTIEEILATTKDYNEIQELVESIRKETRFQYIIVMDMDGIKYSYPYENALGKVYRSGGEKRVLENGEAYVSADRNVLISAIRAFAPIYYNGEQVGAVLVGLLNDTVNKEIAPYTNNFKLFFMIGIIGGIVGAALLAFNIKKAIFGLEPKEIALLMAQREIVLQSLKNGILAVDLNGEIMLFNKAAKLVFNLKEEDIGRNISEFSKAYMDQVIQVLDTKESVYNKEMKIGLNKYIICSHTLLKDYKDDIAGVVSSFQDLTEVKEMAEELIGIKKMTNELRAQSHEYMNKLHTISGLIQLEEYDKAVDYISELSETREKVTSNLHKNIKKSYVAGILLAKYYKAKELRINLEIDPNSYLEEIPESITEGDICSIIGNLIENALDELIKINNGKINVSIRTDESELKILVQDNGRGIDKEIKDKIFERGTTTKEGNRGIGLWIIKQIIDRAGGNINIIVNQGTTWDITIPMKRGV
ncbi:ATP-binding protein [Clostridium sp. DL1XJH146]